MYRLSGIAHLAETSFKAPIDRNQACIGFTEDVSDFVTYDYDKVVWWTDCSRILRKPVDWRDFAFAVHASCWSLTLRFVDSDVENHLHTFLAISLLKRMEELPTKKREFLNSENRQRGHGTGSRHLRDQINRWKRWLTLICFNRRSLSNPGRREADRRMQATTGRACSTPGSATVLAVEAQNSAAKGALRDSLLDSRQVRLPERPTVLSGHILPPQWTAIGAVELLLISSSWTRSAMKTLTGDTYASSSKNYG